MRVMVAMSGGVDSSVAALKMKERGYDVIGATIKTWPKEECGLSGERMCCSLEGVQFARSVAEDLGIPYYVIDLSSEFDEQVKKYFVEEYARGRTPNPCIYCNSRIKFGAFLDKARELGAVKIATGHYARIERSGEEVMLGEARDREKDQTYFLYDIEQEVLSDVEFPLGDITKEQVREIAADKGLMPAGRKSSQDVCFVSKDGGYRAYLDAERGENVALPGDMLDTAGRIIGSHRGIQYYTLGQRKGLGVYGKEALYVVEIDPSGNTITVGARNEAMRSVIKVSSLNWLVRGLPGSPLSLDVKIRYNAAKVTSLLEFTSEGEAIVRMSEPQFAPTPGQAAVFYKGDIVYGGGWIQEVIE